ncbi:hypothetical protein ACN28S_21935 [Cystobacter fuscus]
MKDSREPPPVIYLSDRRPTLKDLPTFDPDRASASEAPSPDEGLSEAELFQEIEVRQALLLERLIPLAAPAMKHFQLAPLRERLDCRAARWRRGGAPWKPGWAPIRTSSCARRGWTRRAIRSGWMPACPSRGNPAAVPRAACTCAAPCSSCPTRRWRMSRRWASGAARAWTGTRAPSPR